LKTLLTYFTVVRARQSWQQKSKENTASVIFVAVISSSSQTLQSSNHASLGSNLFLRSRHGELQRRSQETL